MIQAGEVISYLEMCREEGVNLQRGMNFRLHGGVSVILMSVRSGAPYADRVEENGRVLVYEGHDVPQQQGGRNPKLVDQPMYHPNGKLTQNGLFYRAVELYKAGRGEPELVKVYEKIRPGIWTYNGLFRLVGAWQENLNARSVFKFRLELLGEPATALGGNQDDIEHSRLIPTAVKLAVWRRDRGRCVKCGSQDNLHFDHVIPYSKGGSSLVAENIQLLCARHNLAKSNKLE